MSYLNDPREMAIRPESGVTLEEDNRYETMYHWGAHILDLCDLPVEEYMKPMTVIVNGGGGGGGEESSTTKTYTLKFMLDGTQKASYKLEEGAPIPEVTVEKEGYNFSGWADASGNTPTNMPASNLTLYGSTTIKKFTVKFELDGEELSEYEQIVNWNGKVTRIPSSAKTGYTFSGWEPSIPSAIKDNYTFVGSFNKKSYTVTFNISGETSTAQLEYGDTIVYPASDSKEGYTICGWTPSHATMPDVENLVFNAVLSANPYTVMYLVDAGEGYDHEIVAEYTVRYGENIPTQAVPSQSGYSFSQWSADTQISGNKMPAGDVNFYTKKTVNKYTLTYYVDGVQEGASETYSYGAPVSTRPPYDREGYTATNWVFEPELNISTDDMGIGYSMPYYNVSASCETSINSYPVVIKRGDEVIFSGNVEYGTEISTLIPEGYSYSGETETVPARGIELNADINSYEVVINLAGKEPFTLDLDYKSDIKSAVEDYIAENYPNELVGHHIETNIPSGATVPAHNVNYSAEIVPNEHTITISGASGVVVNYGDNILDAVSGKVETDWTEYIDGWLMDGQPITSADTVPDSDIVVVPVIKKHESSITPVVSGDTAESGATYDYGTPISEVIEDIIASASPETRADLEDPGYEVEWTVNGSAYTDDMVVKEEETTVEVTITPKPFKLSFMRRASAAAQAGLIESGETLYKDAIEYPETPSDIVVDGVTYEFKWDDGSVSAGTPMPSSAVTVYGEYIEKPVVNTVYYGLLNSHKFNGFSENSPEFSEMSSSDGMPSSKEFPFIIELDPRYSDLYDLFYDEEEIDADEFYGAIDSGISVSPVILLPDTISKDDYNWKRDVEPVALTFVKNLTISGATYSMWYEQHDGVDATEGTVEGYYARNSIGIDATIKFENK